MMKRKTLLLSLTIGGLMLACNLPVVTRLPTPMAALASPSLLASSPSLVSPTETPSIQPTIPPSPTLTATPLTSQTPSPTTSPTFTQTPTPTITPTYAILRGEVLERANCRYGPGASYLYKYGLVAGSVLNIIGRNDLGTWIFVQAIGGDNPCWLKATLMNIKGDVLSVAPVDPDIILPWSPYYGPLTRVSATRQGNEVTVFWEALILRAGDDAEQIPYLIEAWVCIKGQIVFTPVGWYDTAATLTDEPGCSEASHGRISGAEKHGYTTWVEIPWPTLAAP
jgi:hypothetical protein